MEAGEWVQAMKYLDALSIIMHAYGRCETVKAALILLRVVKRLNQR